MIYQPGDIRYFEANLKKYGLTLKTYDHLFALQEGRCAICGERESEERAGRIRRLCVDHDHSTGKVRELLCTSCNKALGYIKDSIYIASKVVDYLNKHRDERDT